MTQINDKSVNQNLLIFVLSILFSFLTDLCVASIYTIVDKICEGKLICT